MTAKDLKNSILQLAVQGRLVPQNPDDEPVCLSKNRQKSVDECLFDIPESWRLAHIESICNTIPSKPYQILESEVQKSGLFHVISQSKEYSIGFSNNRNKVFHHDSPVVAFGDHTTTVKYLAFDFVIGADGVKIFLPKPEVVDAKFFFYALQYHVIGLDKVGGYSRHYKFIKNKPIPLPPLTEQKRIVAKIEELMPLVEEYGKVEDRLATLNTEFTDALRKSILQQAIQGKLVEQRPEEGIAKVPAALNTKKKKTRRHGEESEPPFEIPENWRWVRLGDISESVNVGIVIRPTRYYVAQGKGTPAFRNCNIQQGFIDDREWVYLDSSAARENPRSVVKSGDVLIARSGTPGNCCVVPKAYNGRGAVDIVIVRLQTELADSHYIKTFICAPTTHKTLVFASRGVALTHLGATAVASQFVPLPPLAEQKRIVARVNELLAMCDDLKAVSNRTEP